MLLPCLLWSERMITDDPTTSTVTVMLHNRGSTRLHAAYRSTTSCCSASDNFAADSASLFWYSCTADWTPEWYDAICFSKSIFWMFTASSCVLSIFNAHKSSLNFHKAINTLCYFEGCIGGAVRHTHVGMSGGSSFSLILLIHWLYDAIFCWHTLALLKTFLCLEYTWWHSGTPIQEYRFTWTADSVQLSYKKIIYAMSEYTTERVTSNNITLTSNSSQCECVWVWGWVSVWESVSVRVWECECSVCEWVWVWCTCIWAYRCSCWVLDVACTASSCFLNSCLATSRSARASCSWLLSRFTDVSCSPTLSFRADSAWLRADCSCSTCSKKYHVFQLHITIWCDRFVPYTTLCRYQQTETKVSLS